MYLQSSIIEETIEFE